MACMVHGYVGRWRCGLGVDWVWIGGMEAKEEPRGAAPVSSTGRIRSTLNDVGTQSSGPELISDAQGSKEEGLVCRAGF